MAKTIYVGKLSQRNKPSSMFDDHRIIFEPSPEAKKWMDVAKRASWHNKQATDAYEHDQMIKRMKAKVDRFRKKPLIK
tara:strand:- start:241 stop:474 length:234 start_codon:yes stop_codon:yes gene_type:complete